MSGQSIETITAINTKKKKKHKRLKEIEEENDFYLQVLMQLALPA